MIAPVYYNENNKRKAAWLRWLISEGHLPEGFVDDRSIRAIRPDDLGGFRQCHFFAGIGGWAFAAELAGWPANRPLWTGSCPCQPFSSAGRREGRNDPRHLWPDFFRLVRARRPPEVMGEQVASALGYGWFDGVASDLGSENYACRSVDFPAAAVDSPQIRQRQYWLAMDRAHRSGLEDGKEHSLQHAQAGLDLDRPGGPGDLGGADDGRCMATAEREAEHGRGGQRVGLSERADDGGALAGGAGLGGGGRRGVSKRGPQGRTAAAGDDAGEQPGGRALGGAGRVGKPGPGLCEGGSLDDGREHADADGEGALGRAPGAGPQGGERGNYPSREARGWAWRGSVERPDEDFGPVGRAYREGHPQPKLEEFQGTRWWGQGRAASEPDGAPLRNGSWWAEAQWILCHDGKARRVADASTPMLSHGFPGRVLAWSGLGDAIVPQAAVEALIALLEAYP